MENLYSYIELNERCEIYRLHADGISRRRIAAYLDRSPSTISRELKRNILGESSDYKPATADRMAMARKRRGSRIERLSQLKTYILGRLAMELTPEQISGRLTP